MLGGQKFRGYGLEMDFMVITFAVPGRIRPFFAFLIASWVEGAKRLGDRFSDARIRHNECKEES